MADEGIELFGVGLLPDHGTMTDGLVILELFLGAIAVHIIIIPQAICPCFDFSPQRGGDLCKYQELGLS